MTHQRRNKPEPTEALVERVRDGLRFISAPDPDTYHVAAAALTELTERLAEAQATQREWAAEAGKLSERLAAAERERDEALARIPIAEFLASETAEARVKVLEEALDEIIAVPSVSEQNRVVQIARTALSQVREP